MHFDAFVEKQFQEFKREDLRRERRGELRGLPAFRLGGRHGPVHAEGGAPVGGQGVEAVADGEAEEFRRHAAGDLLPAAVAHGHEEVDDADRGEAAEQAALVEQDGVRAAAARGHGRRDARDAAAADDHAAGGGIGRGCIHGTVSELKTVADCMRKPSPLSS